MRVGDIIKIGSDEFVVIATGDETGKGVLTRSLETHTAGYLLPYVEYEVIRHIEISYGEAKEDKEYKKKRELMDAYISLGQVIGQLADDALEKDVLFRD